jgi:hypothetical protein
MMEIDVTSLTNADLSKLSERVANERDARIADPSRGPPNRPLPLDPMAAYHNRERSLPDRVADLEKRLAAPERRT